MMKTSLCCAVFVLLSAALVKGEEDYCFKPCFTRFTFTAQHNVTSDAEMCIATSTFISCIKMLCNVTSVPASAYGYPKAVYNVTGFQCVDIPTETTTAKPDRMAQLCPGYHTCFSEYIKANLPSEAAGGTTSVPNSSRITCVLMDTLNHCLSIHCSVPLTYPPLQDLVNLFGRKLAEKGYPCVRESTTAPTTTTTEEPIIVHYDSQGYCDGYRRCEWRHSVDVIEHTGGTHECRFPEEYFACVKLACSTSVIIIPEQYLKDKEKSLRSRGYDCRLTSSSTAPAALRAFITLMFLCAFGLIQSLTLRSGG